MAKVVRMARGRIPERDIAAIRERTPIEEIVAEYVQLKPGGADSLKGLSPFKDERTPSFHVRPNHGYYHCFSTGKGGDVFSFLMEMEHLSFPEAVEACAERIGYTINYEGGGTGRREEPGTRRRLMEANKAAHAFYRDQLETPEAQVARDFLADRGFTEEQWRRFGCGYAPDGWDTMTRHLQRKGFSAQELEKAGLSTQGRRGPIDRFRRRLLWPIRNLSGDVIGFGARKLFEDDNLGKYMNTPDTLLYHKSKVLFGLDLAKKDIAASHRAIVVEGYTDVMAMHAAGETTAVAACGTAFGEGHLTVLRRLLLDDSFFRGELIYTFDGDEAGQKAAMRAFEGDQRFTGQSYVAVAPDGMDPCDLRMARGDVAVRELVASRTPIIEFVVRTLMAEHDLDLPGGRVEAIHRVVPVLAKLADPALRDEYAREVAGWIGFGDEAEMVRMVREEAANPTMGETQRRRARREEERERLAEARRRQEEAMRPGLHRPDPSDPRLNVEREVLKLAIQEPGDVDAAMFDALDPEMFTDEAYRALFGAIVEAGGLATAAATPMWAAAVASGMEDETARSLMSELGVEEIRVDPEGRAGYASSLLARLQEVWVGEQISQVKRILKRMRLTDDKAAYRETFGDLVALENYRRLLLDAALGRGDAAPGA